MTILYMIFMGQGKTPEDALAAVLGMKPAERIAALAAAEDPFRAQNSGGMVA